MVERPRITIDRAGTPGLWASGVPQALYGLGYLHARHRPLQALLLHCAGRGELAGTFIARDQLVAIDALVHRLDLPERGRAAAARLDARTAAWLDAYLEGFAAALHRYGLPFELKLLAARPRLPDRASLLSGLLVSAFLGLAQGQERMERALVDAVQAGAEVPLLRSLFAPHLDGFVPGDVAGLHRTATRGFAIHGMPPLGGSNAWAVHGARSANGTSLLAGDPHLQVNQMPSLLYEVRARVGDDYWLGATIPGLPGVMVGRNRHVAWAGTFAVADNVDLWVEELERGQARRDGRLVPLVVREVEVPRRWRDPVRLRFFATDRGVLERDAPHDGPALCSRWAGADRPAEAMGAYLMLLTARSAAEAERVLAKGHAFSLHFVLADRTEVRYRQAGRVPKRTPGWSGLYPVRARGGLNWLAFYEGDELPRRGPVDGVVVSANEARLADDGRALSTLAQPPYRLERIGALLAATRTHDPASLMAIQRDVLSLQAERLRPQLLAHLPPGQLARELAAWDLRYTPTSVGAHAFELARRAALSGLSPRLGGGWLEEMLDTTELGTWWCSALDRALADPAMWAGAPGATLRRALGRLGGVTAAPWGEARRLAMPHLVLGGLPRWLGLDRGPFPLQGSVATVSQASVVHDGGVAVTVAPAYRFVTDLGEDAAHAALPGGIDGNPRSATYDVWLDAYREGRYHVLAPPTDDEGVASELA